MNRLMLLFLMLNFSCIRSTGVVVEKLDFSNTMNISDVRDREFEVLYTCLYSKEELLENDRGLHYSYGIAVSLSLKDTIQVLFSPESIIKNELIKVHDQIVFTRVKAVSAERSSCLPVYEKNFELKNGFRIKNYPSIVALNFKLLE